MKTLIKICGIKRLDDLECAIQNGADLIGFVFVKSSPRYIEPSSVTNLLQSVPEKIKTVAVMQHATQNSLDSILVSFKPTYIQTDADDFLSLDLFYPLKTSYEACTLQVYSAYHLQCLIFYSYSRK